VTVEYAAIRVRGGTSGWASSSAEDLVEAAVVATAASLPNTDGAKVNPVADADPPATL
jgi:hypothetical protein